jgi:LysM repeat protein
MWMINNQFNRRNLPIETRLTLAYKFKGFEEEKARDRQLGNLKQFTEVETAETRQSTVSPPVGLREETKGKTLESIAKKAGVSSRTAEQYDTIQRKGTEVETAETRQSTVRLPVTQRDQKQNNKTLEVIAQKAGVGYSTAFQYDTIQRKGTEVKTAETRQSTVSALVR